MFMSSIGGYLAACVSGFVPVGWLVGEEESEQLPTSICRFSFRNQDSFERPKIAFLPPASYARACSR